MNRLILCTCVVVWSAALAGCGSGGGGSGASATCVTGDLRCACYPNDTCNGRLICASKVCVELPGQDAAIPGVDGAAATGGMTSGAGGTGGIRACAAGDMGCACFTNNLCNGSLACVWGICADPSLVGGTISGGALAGVPAVDGGIIPAGGVTAIPTGGIPSTGGTVTGTTGGSLAGGTTTLGNGGTISTGGIIPGGGTTTTGGGGTITTGGSIPSGGTTGGGGAITSVGGIATGGTTALGGGGAVAPGGATSTATTAAAQVCSDATHCSLGLEGERAPGTGNSYGIEGTFYLVGDGCATLTWDAQTRCASGTLCAKDPPNYTHWGAEVALNLRTGGGYDYPYDSTAFGVTGFFWEISGTAPGMQVWVPLTTNQGACLQTDGCALNQPPWGNPAPSLGPSGKNYVQLQTSAMSYDDWGSSYDYPPPWDPAHLHSLVWKLPSRSTATAFSFCVQKVGVLHN